MALKVKLVIFSVVFSFAFMIAGIRNTLAQGTAPPEIEFVDSLKMNVLPVGSGARALGMGGAFTAIADDGTAVSWNPAGLVNLEHPEASIVVSYTYTINNFQDFTSSDSGSISQYQFGSDEKTDTLDTNFVNYSYPFVVFDKFTVLSLSYQQIYNFNTTLKYRIETPISLLPARTSTLDYQSTGGIAAISPALAVLLTKDISFGVALNVLGDKISKIYTWKEELNGEIILFKESIDSEVDDIITISEQKRFDGFSAYNLSFGLLYDIFKKGYRELTIGLAYDTGYTGEITRNRMYSSHKMSTGQSETTDEREEINITFPQSLSFGIAYQMSKSSTVSLDIGWTDWSEWILEGQDGKKYRPIGFEVPADKKISDTYSIKAGIEYLLYFEDKIIPFRGGLFYDPKPSIDQPTDVFGFSVGTGLTTEQFSLDIAYQFRYADNIDARDFGIIGGHYDEREHRLFCSLIKKF